MSAENDTPAGRPRGSARPGYSFDVKLWKVSRTGRKSRPWRLRWVVAGQVHGDTFTTSALAESRRSELWQAMNRRGEAFEIESGLPESEVRAAAEAAEAADAEPPLRWFEFCRKYVAGRWRTGAAKTREGMADGLAAVTLAMVKRGDSVPGDETLRLAFRWGVVPANAGEEPPAELKAAYDWITTTDRPLGDLADPEVFEDVLYRLSYKLDGTPAASDTYKRRRRALNTALEHAVVAGDLPENPLQRARRKHVGSNDVVDRRVLVNAVQARQLLTAVSYVGSWDRCRGRRLVAFYAVLYYAGLRPAEAVGLRRSDCHLPEMGWGTLTLRETRPVSGKQWTDSGERHDRRGLKARGGVLGPAGPHPACPGRDPPCPPEGVRDRQGGARVRERAWGSRRLVDVLAHMGGGAGVRPAAGACRVAVGRSPVRPAARVHHAVVERGGPDC